MSNNRVGIYTRVSSDTQVIEGHSLEWQELELERYAKEHKLNVIDKYVEKGISGEDIETRPQLKRLLEDVKSKKINNVLVYKVDRLGRQNLTNAIIASELVNSKCSLTTSAYGEIDLQKAYGQFIYNIFSSLSQFEVDNLSERVKNGKKQRVRNGLYINSYNVYGYDNYYDSFKGTRLLKINEFESKIIKNIYELYLNGISMNNIAKELNNKKIPCKRGGHWCQSTIYQILTNKLYIGIVVYNGNEKKDYFENKGVHTPIIDLEIFHKVQDLIKSKKRYNAKKFPNEYSYFSPVLVCGKDNSSFKPKQTKAKDKTSVRYYCKNKDCLMPSIKHTDLEIIFANELKCIKLEYNEKCVKEVFKNEEYDIILKMLNKLKNEQNELFDYHTNNIIQDDDFKERLNIINTKKQELQKMQEKLKRKIIIYNNDIKNKVVNLLNNNLMITFENLSQIDKMNFVNLFIDKIIIYKDHTINIKWKKQ